MSYKVRIDSFEGPFDLLLYLVSRQKVDIGAISITQIADQYLAEVGRMDNLDLDVASDFLLVASTLLILILMPVFYLIFYGRKYKKEQKMNEANMA